MTGGILGEDDFLTLAAEAAEVVDAADVAARNDAVATGREVDLLADDRDGAGIFDEFRREEGDHVERAPENVALATRKEVARFNRVIDDRELHVEAVLFEEDALFAGV